MLKIYGADLSSPANKVRMAANALQIDYQYIRINIREGENRMEKFLRLHPAGKIPVIDDNGFILFESNAIIRYLASSEVSSLYPEDLKQKAAIDQWIDFTSLHVGAAVGRVLFNRVFVPHTRIPFDERSLSDGLKFLDRYLPVIDGQLGKMGHIAGEHFSLADIALLATLDPAEAAGIQLKGYENIMKWRKALMQKDFYTSCHKSYEEAVKNILPVT